jgi:hypothetical protein
MGNLLDGFDAHSALLLDQYRDCTTKGLVRVALFPAACALLVLVGLYKSRSVFTAIEFVVLMTSRVRDPLVTFASFSIAKLLQSFLWFLGDYRDKSRPQYSEIVFHSWFYHSGFTWGEWLYDFSTDPADDADADSVSSALAGQPAALRPSNGTLLGICDGLLPRRRPLSKAKNSWVRVWCGQARLAPETLKQAMQELPVSGACHNWAQTTIYELSSDKYFSFAILAFLRWEVWILSIFFALLVLEEGDRAQLIATPCAAGTNYGPIADLMLICLAVYDSLQLRPRHLAANRHSSWSREFAKFATLWVMFAVVRGVVSHFHAESRSLHQVCAFLLLGIAMAILVTLAHGYCCVGPGAFCCCRSRSSSSKSRVPGSVESGQAAPVALSSPLRRRKRPSF